MNQKDLGEKLRIRRERFRLKQDYLAIKMNVNQSTVSLLENGELKFTDELMEKIKAIERFEDFDQEPNDAEVQPAGPQPIVMKWPWGKPSLYILISCVALFFLNQAFIAAEDLSRGFSDGAGPDAKVHIGLIVVFVTVFGFLIYWFFWKKKW